MEGEHRLGEGMRRGVFCLGLVPVATGLTLREAMWMQCCLTAGVDCVTTGCKSLWPKPK